MVGLRQMLLKEPMLDGGQRYWTCHDALFSLDGAGRASHRGQPGDGLVLKELFGCELQTRLVSSGDNLNAENGIAPQFKEVAVDAHSFEAEDVGPDCGKDLFSSGAGRDKIFLEKSLGCLGRGQATAV